MDKSPDQGSMFKEFAPRDKDQVRCAGRLVIRSTNYLSRLGKFDRLFEVLAADAAGFEPPLEIDRDKVEVVHYSGKRYAGTYGLEVTIPEGHVVSDEYVRINGVEQKY